MCNAVCFSKNSILPETSTIDPPRPKGAWVTASLLREKQYKKTWHELSTSSIPSVFNFKELGLPTYPMYYPPALSKFNSGYPYWRKIDATRCRNLCQRAKRCSFFTYSYYTYLCATYHRTKPYPLTAISGRKHDASLEIKYMIELMFDGWYFRYGNCVVGDSITYLKLKKQNSVVTCRKGNGLWSETYGFDPSCSSYRFSLPSPIGLCCLDGISGCNEKKL